MKRLDRRHQRLDLNDAALDLEEVADRLSRAVMAEASTTELGELVDSLPAIVERIKAARANLSLIDAFETDK